MDKNFKIGDKVICINKNMFDDEIDKNINSKRLSKLNKVSKIIEIEKIYIINDIFKLGDKKLIKINIDINFYFSSKRFVSLSEYRKLKINKINEES